MDRPQPSEHAPYYGLYIDQVPAGDILQILGDEMVRTQTLLAAVPADRADHRYQPGKWSIKEIVAHLIDSERMFAYRALSFARGDPAALPAFEQDAWVTESQASRRPLDELAHEFGATRKSHITMFASFDDEMALRRGVASGFEFTVRTFPYIIAGHEIHHRHVLEQRYL